MTVNIVVTVVKNGFPTLSPETRMHVQRAIADTLSDIERGAKERAPVDTGAMRAGIHRKMLAPLIGIVATDPSADYAVFVHEGTRKMSARPFLRQAAEAVRAIWSSRLHAAILGAAAASTSGSASAPTATAATSTAARGKINFSEAYRSNAGLIFRQMISSGPSTSGFNRARRTFNRQRRDMQNFKPED